MSAGGLGADAVLDAGLERDAAERRDDRDPPAAQVVRAEARPPSRRRDGQARRVGGCEPGAHVVVAGRVAHRAGEAAEHDGVRAACRRAGSRGMRPNVPFMPEQPGVAGRDADRAAAVAAGGEGHEPAGDRGRRPARRAADGAAVPPRVVRDAVELGDAHVEAAELAGGRLPDRHRAAAARAAARRWCDVCVGDAVAEHERRLGVRPARDRLELLDARRARRRTAATRRPRGRGRGARSASTMGEGVEVASASIAASVASSSSTGERSPRPEGVDERAGVTRPRF